MTDTPTTATVAATLARIKSELPSDTAVNIDGLITDIAFVAKEELNAAIRQNAPHLWVVGGFITNTGVSLADTTLDNMVAGIEAAVAAQLAPTS